MNNHSLQTSVLNSQTNNLYESIQLTFEENYYSTIRKKISPENDFFIFLSETSLTYNLPKTSTVLKAE